MDRILPILFKSDMVQAILDGRKTVTRRLIKKSQCMMLSKKEPSELPRHLYAPFDEMTDAEVIKSGYKPPYSPGSILYVRETWHKYTKRIGNGENCRLQEFYGYKASIANSEDGEEKWHPSIHMPKEAARIWLRVNDVRVERLQDMKDAYREGIHFCDCPTGYTWKQNTDMHNCYTDPITAMKALWDSTVKNTERDKYGWDANPWVWVIEFERCRKPEL